MPETADEYYEDDADETPAPPKRRAASRRKFAEGATEGSGGTVTAVRDEEPEPEEPEPEEADDEAPTSAPKGVIRRGWGGSQKVMDSTSTFANRLVTNDESVLIKFLEDSPYAGYSRHWVERNTEQGSKTVPFVCLDSADMGPCPLCEVGHRRQAVSAFNVAQVDDDGTVSLKTWDVGQRIFQALKKYNSDAKIGPLTKGFFTVTTTGKGRTSNTQTIPTRESTLREDGVPVPLDEELDKLGLYDSSIIQIPSRKELKEIAAEMASDDEYDD